MAFCSCFRRRRQQQQDAHKEKQKLIQKIEEERKYIALIGLSIKEATTIIRAWNPYLKINYQYWPDIEENSELIEDESICIFYDYAFEKDDDDVDYYWEIKKPKYIQKKRRPLIKIVCDIR